MGSFSRILLQPAPNALRIAETVLLAPRLIKHAILVCLELIRAATGPASIVLGAIATVVMKMNAWSVLVGLLWLLANASNAKVAVLTVLLNHPQSVPLVRMLFMD